METIAAAAATAANVMRMRRGKRQYRRVCRGMESLPVELAAAAGGRGGGDGMTERSAYKGETKTKVRGGGSKERTRSASSVRPARAQSIIIR